MCSCFVSIPCFTEGSHLPLRLPLKPWHGLHERSGHLMRPVHLARHCLVFQKRAPFRFHRLPACNVPARRFVRLDGTVSRVISAQGALAIPATRVLRALGIFYHTPLPTLGFLANQSSSHRQAVPPSTVFQGAWQPYKIGAVPHVFLPPAQPNHDRRQRHRL